MAKSPYAELPSPLDIYLPKMFASYPNLNECHPSSWFTWTNGKVSSYTAVACHAKLEDDGSGWDNLITAVPKTDQLSLEYLRMLIRGPFRSMSDLIKLDRVKDNYYLHLLSLDKWPANVLMNFCIASRIPIEFEYLLSPWAKRCEAGFDPVLAFLLTYSYGCKKYTQEQYKDRTFQFMRSGHLWFDPASNWWNILNGTFENVSGPFKTHPKKVIPTNTVWGISADYRLLINLSDVEIADFYKQPIKILEPAPIPVLIKAKKKPFPAYPQHLLQEIFNPPIGWAQLAPQQQQQQQPIEHNEPENEPGEPIPWPDELDGDF